jgi:hypothetical protein
MKKKWFFIEIYGRHPNMAAKGSYTKSGVFYEDENGIGPRINLFKQESVVDSISVYELTSDGIQRKRNDLSK